MKVIHLDDRGVEPRHRADGVQALPETALPEEGAPPAGVVPLRAATPSLVDRRAYHRPEFRPAFTQLLLDHAPDHVHVHQLADWNYDLVRVAGLLGYPVLVDCDLSTLEALNGAGGDWVADSLDYAVGLRPAEPDVAQALIKKNPALADRILPREWPDEQCYDHLATVVSAMPCAAGDYAAYEFGLRDEGLLERMQVPHVPHFTECERVLDVACGPGIFLRLLEDQGVRAEGVERNHAAVRYATGLGLRVHEADALDFLESTGERYDGIYCSHFIEHLPVAAAERLMAALARTLQPGGVLVMVFPNPESIRSQLLGFWRDPEHIRFYHPELVALMGRGVGLKPVSGHEGRAIPVFPLDPPWGPGFPAVPLREDSPEGGSGSGLMGRGWRALLRWAGVMPGREVVRHLQRAEARQARLESSLASLREENLALREGLEQLWTVNRTWAWDDNACLIMRRPEA